MYSKSLNKPKRILEIEGIGRQRLDSIIAAWSEQKDIRELMVFLHSIGLGTERAQRIYRRYGADTVAQIKNNPYCLIESMHGIGFGTADKIAQALGIEADAPVRVEAGLRHVLQQNTQYGHCATLEELLIHETATLLNVQPDAIA